MNLPASSIDLSAYSPEDLIRLRSRIEDHLQLSLDQIDLNQELLIQFKLTRLMFQGIQDDEDIQANHKTQAINACAALLKQISEAQVTLYTASRAQRLEAVLISALHQHPELEATFRREMRDRLDG